MDDLQEEYLRRGESVLFLEQNDYEPVGARIDRFWNAYGGTVAAVPKVIIDSGYRVISGSQWDYHAAYRKLIQEALQRPAQADIAARYTLEGQTALVEAQVRNLSDQVLSETNYATVTAIVYENAHIVHTQRFVRAAPEVPIRAPLAIGDQATFRVRAEIPATVSWQNCRIVVLVDYQPDIGSPRYDLLQAAFAVPAAMSQHLFLPSSLNGS